MYRLILILLFLGPFLHAQPGPRKTFPYEDSGPAASRVSPCITPSFYNATDTGVLYVCQNAGWVALSGGSVSATGLGIVVTNNGLACDGITDDSSAMRSLLNTVGTIPAKLVFPSGQCLLSSTSFPANVTLDFSSGGAIKNLPNTTAPGGGNLVQVSTPTVNYATYTNSCSTSFPVPVASGNTVIFFTEHRFMGVDDVLPSDNQSDFFRIGTKQTFNFSSIVSNWFASNVKGGNTTVTLNFPQTRGNECVAIEVTGLGPSVNVDSGRLGIESVASTTMTTAGSPSSGTVTFSTGAFVAGAGGNSYVTDVCTPQTSYTLDATLGGQSHVPSPGDANGSGTGETLCIEHINSHPGGATNLTIGIDVDPLVVTGTRAWFMNAVGLIPGPALINVLGGIANPDNHQIFYSATGTDGSVDFTRNTVLQAVYPEWWGASSSAAAATNTPAIQAAIVGAFGNDRVNGSGLTQYNKELRFSGTYNINGTLIANHMNGFRWTCLQRLACGLNQTATNTSILTTTTGGAYGVFQDIYWSTSAAQDLAHPLVDLNYTAAPGNDLVTQFIDFERNGFNGNNLAATGFRVAAAGGTAQGSNIYFWDNNALGFTEACYMVGAGSGGVATTIATNAIAITWYGGDIQGCPAYGIESFGGTELKVDGMTFENGFATQTGYDIGCYQQPAGNQCELYNVRSESRRLAAGSKMVIHDSFLQDQSFNIPAGNSPAVGTIIKGSSAGGDGRYYKVTVQGAMGGAASEAAPLTASSGSGTTIVDTNQNITGAVTQGAFANASIGETMTQAVTGATGARLNTPTSTGTITGSVTSGTIGSNHTMTQATTGITCTSSNAPTGTQSLTCSNFSGTADSSHTWTDGTTGGVYTPTAVPVFSASSLVISAATGSPDNSHLWTGGTSGAIFTPTGVPTNQAAFTNNAFVGMQVTTTGVGGTAGNGKNQYCIVTSNDATSITCSGGWLTKIQSTTIANPDTTTLFFVEPNWGTQFTAGGATWAAADTYIMDNQGGGTYLIANNVFLPGGRVALDPRSDLRNVRFTDINWGGNAPEAEIVNQHLDNVQVISTVGNSLFRVWRPVRQGITGLANYSLEQKGTVPICWAAGQTSSNTATVDICIKPDPNGTGTKNGRLQLLNNSSGTTKTWSFNADGSTSVPGNFIAPTYQTTLSTPTTSGDTCTAGQMWADASFVYVCTASNTIKRAALTAF